MIEPGETLSSAGRDTQCQAQEPTMILKLWECLEHYTTHTNRQTVRSFKLNYAKRLPNVIVHIFIILNYPIEKKNYVHSAL